MKNIRFFFISKVSFLVVKISIYLNRRPFVMVKYWEKDQLTKYFGQLKTLVRLWIQEAQDLFSTSYYFATQTERS